MHVQELDSPPRAAMESLVPYFNNSGDSRRWKDRGREKFWRPGEN
jgi:hypothetical protein